MRYANGLAVMCGVLLASCGGGPHSAEDAGADGKNDYYYGDPDNALTGFACIDGETDALTGFGRFAVCLPACSDSSSCPDAPDGASAAPSCDGDRCYLECTRTAECPSDMTCVPERGVCMFERVECTDDPDVCPAEMPCREAGTTGLFFCLHPR